MSEMVPFGAVLILEKTIEEFNCSIICSSRKNPHNFNDSGCSWNEKQSVWDVITAFYAAVHSVEMNEDIINWINSVTKECLFRMFHSVFWAAVEVKWIVCYVKVFEVIVERNMLVAMR